MHCSSEQNVSQTLISLARLRLIKYGRFWLLSGRREVGAEIRELPENTGDLATLHTRMTCSTNVAGVERLNLSHAVSKAREQRC